jgi:hypothetical protein
VNWIAKSTAMPTNITAKATEIGFRVRTVAAAKAPVAASPVPRVARITHTMRFDRTAMNNRRTTAMIDNGVEISTPLATVMKLSSVNATDPVSRTR